MKQIHLVSKEHCQLQYSKVFSTSKTVDLCFLWNFCETVLQEFLDKILLVPCLRILRGKSNPYGLHMPTCVSMYTPPPPLPPLSLISFPCDHYGGESIRCFGKFKITPPPPFLSTMNSSIPATDHHKNKTTSLNSGLSKLIKKKTLTLLAIYFVLNV